jgi:hypothetical protein
MNEQKFHAHTLASSGAIVAAVSMLLLGIGANIGVYEGAAEMMRQWHMFFSFSFVGIITGMIEAAIITYVFLYAFAWVYNKMLKRGGTR